MDARVLSTEVNGRGLTTSCIGRRSAPPLMLDVSRPMAKGLILTKTWGRIRGVDGHTPWLAQKPDRVSVVVGLLGSGNAPA
jgi:hypothetical protein